MTPKVATSLLNRSVYPKPFLLVLLFSILLNGVQRQKQELIFWVISDIFREEGVCVGLIALNAPPRYKCIYAAFNVLNLVLHF
jgi:hypothetical protein